MPTATPRRLRYYDPAYYHEVTQRIRDGRFLLDPNCPDLKAAIFGQLAESMEKYRVTLVALHFMTDHFHALYGIGCPYQFAKFLAHFHAGLTRAYNRLRGTKANLWHEMRWLPVDPDEQSVVWRMRYILGQAVAAGLVDHPAQFPGASTIDWMLEGAALRGHTFAATARCRHRARVGGPDDDSAYVTPRVVTVTPPSCWSHLSPEQLRQRYIEVTDAVARVPYAELPPDRRAVPVKPTPRPEPEAFAVEDASPGRAEGQDPRLCQEVVLKQESPESEVSAGRPSTRPAGAAKLAIPGRSGQDGGPYEAGPVRPKRRRSAGDGRRSAMPLILTRCPRARAAFEAVYRAAVEAYRAAKRAWRERQTIDAAGLRGEAFAVPAFTLVGTMPYPA